jgi:hypothetical protein
MIFKLLEAAEGRWRRLNGYRLVPLVRARARFVNAELIEGSEEKVAAWREIDPQHLTVPPLSNEFRLAVSSETPLYYKSAPP